MTNWEDLRYFLAVARTGTLTAAARELRVSHSTVLRRIEQFEHSLDSKLFKRLQSGYQLTAAGEQLFASSKPLENELDRVLEHASGHSDATAGKLRVSQPEIGILNIYPLYAQFQRQHPDISLEVQSTMRTHNITQQEVDVVLRIASTPPDLLVGRELGTIKARAYASKYYLEQLPKNYSPRDFSWILWQAGADRLKKHWQTLNIEQPHIALHTESMPDVISAVLSGMGVGFLSSHEAVKHKSLVPLFDGQLLSEYKLWLLTHRDLRNSERVKKFMQFITEKLIL